LTNCNCSDKYEDKVYDNDYERYYITRECTRCGYYWEGYGPLVVFDDDE